jgi:hypothetical protein
VEEIAIQAANNPRQNVEIVVAGDRKRMDCVRRQPIKAAFQRASRLKETVVVIDHIPRQRHHINLLFNGALHDGFPHPSAGISLGPGGIQARGTTADMKVARSKDLQHGIPCPWTAT